MVFGIAGAPAIFQRFIYDILVGVKGNECFVYSDDLVIFENTCATQSKPGEGIVETRSSG